MLRQSWLVAFVALFTVRAGRRKRGILERAPHRAPRVHKHDTLPEGARRPARTIAFPYHHVVVTARVTWFPRGTPPLWVLLVLNILMIPAAMPQGGHHAVDLLGGALVLAVSLGLVERLGRAGRRSL
jgi:hypothetical protein